MVTSDLERIKAFEHRFARAQASDVVDLPWGYAVLQRDFPASHDHNRVVVTAGAGAADVLGTVDEVLGGAGLEHRYVSIDDDALGHELSPDFVAAGYEQETIVTMIFSGGEPSGPTSKACPVTLDQLHPALVRHWRLELPDHDHDVHHQLAARSALYERGADATMLAVYDHDEIAAHANLFIDPVERLAQFENLVTHPHFRGRGYAGSLLSEALSRGRAAGCDLIFLSAALTDWPIEWYRRVGFVDTARTHHFTRAAERGSFSGRPTDSS